MEWLSTTRSILDSKMLNTSNKWTGPIKRMRLSEFGQFITRLILYSRWIGLNTSSQCYIRLFSMLFLFLFSLIFYSALQNILPQPFSFGFLIFDIILRRHFAMSIIISCVNLKENVFFRQKRFFFRQKY